MLKYFQIMEKYKNAKTYEEYNEILAEIEKSIDFDKTTFFPIFTISYPSHIEKDKMESSHVLSLNLTEIELRQLIENGFSLMDKSILDNKKELIANPFEKMFGEDSHILVDTRYGVLVGNMNGCIVNISLDHIEIERYLQNYPFLTSRTDYLSIGARIANDIKYSSESNEIITYTVKSRKEFNRIITEWHELLKDKSELSIWYRGQTDEYKIPRIIELPQKVCPWRDVTDVSLTPSIYREGKNIKEYVDYMLEMMVLQEQFTKPFASLKRATREMDAECIEKIPEQLLKLEWTITRQVDGESWSIEDSHVEYFSYIELLLQQHYGIESPLLDITKDPDVALFFAQNKIEGKKYIKINYEEHKPVVYVFILNNKLDPIIDSEILMKEFSALRPIRQKCGILSGATQVKKDFYSKFVAIRICLDEYLEFDEKYTQDYLFPSRGEDKVLDLIMRIKEENDLRNISPLYIDDLGR